MKLLPVFKQVLKEQVQIGNIVEFPNSNFVASLFPMEKRIMFSPIEHFSLTNEIKSVVENLRDSFRTIRIESEGQGSFAVEFDPREDFDTITEFLHQYGI